MAALNGTRIVTGLIVGAAVLGSCSSNTNASGPATSVEQTVSPSPSASPSPAADFVLRTATADDWPAVSDPADYVFSDTPQSKGEQFIKDSYPDLWDQGVRALSPKYMDGYEIGDEKVPGATAQYIDGKRYEGTNRMPLGFRGQTSSPESFPTDTFANVLQIAKDPSTTVSGPAGTGGYSIQIIENIYDERATNPDINQSNDTQLTISEAWHMGGQLEKTMRFADPDAAWAYIQTNGIKVDGMERPLYPGEVAYAAMQREIVSNGHPTGLKNYVWDGAAGNWVLAGTTGG